MRWKTITRLPTEEEIKAEAAKWARDITVGDVSCWTTSLSDAFILGAKYVINEFQKGMEWSVHPYNILRNLTVGKSVIFPQYLYGAARTAASKLKKDFNAVYTVNKVRKNGSYEKWCIATRIE